MHICTHAVALSLFVLCIERTLATLFYRSYASVGSRVAKVIVPFQVCLSTCVCSRYDTAVSPFHTHSRRQSGRVSVQNEETVLISRALLPTSQLVYACCPQYVTCALLFYYQIYTIDGSSSMSICSLITSSNQHRTTHVQVGVFSNKFEKMHFQAQFDHDSPTFPAQIAIFALELASLVVFAVLSAYNKHQLRQTIGMRLKWVVICRQNERALGRMTFGFDNTIEK